MIANSIAGTSKYKSLQFGVQSGQGNVLNYMSWAGAGQGLPCESDPARMYSRIFASFMPPSGGSTGPDPAAVRLFQQRRSILDAVKGSYDSLLPRVSVEDRAKLDAHATAIRSIETRLVVDPGTLPPTTTGALCMKPASPTIDVRKNDNFPAIGRLQMDLLLMAHACDLTHVSALQFSRESADPVFTWLNMGITRGHHAISHDATSNTTSQTQLAAIDKWHAEQYAYLIAGMQRLGLLDSSLVVWVNGLAAGNAHSHGPTLGNYAVPATDHHGRGRGRPLRDRPVPHGRARHEHECRLRRVSAGSGHRRDDVRKPCARERPDARHVAQVIEKDAPGPIGTSGGRVAVRRRRGDPLG